MHAVTCAPDRADKELIRKRVDPQTKAWTRALAHDESEQRAPTCMAKLDLRQRPRMRGALRRVAAPMKRGLHPGRPMKTNTEKHPETQRDRWRTPCQYQIMGSAAKQCRSHFEEGLRPRPSTSIATACSTLTHTAPEDDDKRPDGCSVGRGAPQSDDGLNRQVNKVPGESPKAENQQEQLQGQGKSHVPDHMGDGMSATSTQPSPEQRSRHAESAAAHPQAGASHRRRCLVVPTCAARFWVAPGCVVS